MKLRRLVVASAAAALCAIAIPVSSASAAVDCSQYKQYGDLSGKTVHIFTSILSPESDIYMAAYKDFETCTKATIQWEGSNDFESQLNVRVAGGSAPDLAVIPQPGLLQKMVQSGKAVPAPAGVVANAKKYWSADWRAYSTVNGKYYGSPLSANMKSLVWYSPKKFKKLGLKVPTTWAQMMNLSNTIVKKGFKPWCAGIGSGTATGWPATDWMEELVLRQLGPKVYDSWVAGKTKFADPKIQKVMKTLAAWLMNPKYVNAGIGDVKSIATTTFQDAGLGIPKGKCFMLQQASFYGAQFPKGTTIGPKGDVFAFFLPAINKKWPIPVEGGGEFIVSFRNAPEVNAVQTFLSSPLYLTKRAKLSTGGWTTANSGVPASAYPTPLDKMVAKYLANPKATFRFDGSDAMPAAVGAGSFWTQMTAWFSGNNPSSPGTIKAIAQAIDSTWPTS